MAIIGALFRQTVTIHPYLRFGAGEPVYGDAETRKCRIETGKRLTSKSAAKGVLEGQPSGALMFCVGSPIPIRSIVEYGNREYVVTECSVMTGFSDDHLEVTLE